jgi:signal transduction histidine kinase
MAASLLQFDAATAMRMLGYVYALMALAMFVLFKRMHLGRGSLAWSLGILSASLGAFAFSLRGVAPDWVTVYAANLLDFMAYGMAITSLRAEVGLELRRKRTVLAVLLAWGALFVAEHHSAVLRTGLGTALHALGAALLTTTTVQVARVAPMRGVRLIGLAFASYVLALILLAVDRFTPNVVTADNPNGVTFALYLVVLSSVASCVYGTLGYISMAMERLRGAEIGQAAALASASAQRAAAEEHERQLQLWLDERDQLVRVLAHDVRLPLNVASSALQAARTALTPDSGGRRSQPATVEQRVQRAQSVLGQVVASLDNTLAATALLASPDRVAQQDTDVDLLLQLSLGDIDATQVHRLVLERLSGTHTASMDAGLMRLALRNLLNHALAHSDPGTPLVLRVSDSDEPLALVFEVIHNGPGAAPAKAPRRLLHNVDEQAGQGLGLHVVQRVAELHDSKVEIEHRECGGSIFRFVLMQGVH